MQVNEGMSIFKMTGNVKLLIYTPISLAGASNTMQNLIQGAKK